MASKVQSGVTIAAPEAPWTISHDLPVPVPGPGQVLVKSLVSGVNPVEIFMHSGTLVTAWPAVLGCDASGVVVAVGSGCTKLAVGNRVFGCTRVGQNQYMTYQDAFLMDEDITFKADGGVLGLEAAATVGVGVMTAALALVSGAGLKLPEPGTQVAVSDDSEWIIVLGSTGSVGQYGVQIARLCGYKVLAACSPSKAETPLGAGATATFNSRGDLSAQLAEIKRVTGGKFAGVLDASAFSYDLAIAALEQVCTARDGVKWFATVDDWSPFNTASTIREHRVELGHMGREDEEMGVQVTNAVRAFVPAIEAHLAAGTLKPLEYELMDGVGYDAVVQAIKRQEKGGLAKKLVVRVKHE